MMKFQYIIILVLVMLCSVTTFTSCDDDDSFSSNYTNALSFEVEELSLDTVFSKIASPYKMFKVYNNTGDGLRITSVKQEKGARKSGFRVNVCGSYIDPDQNNTISDIELRSGDSLRVWVEITSPAFNDSEKPQLKEDNLLFTLESGRVQSLPLKAWTWDADTLHNKHIQGNYTIDNANGKPLIIYGTLTVDTLSTLNIAKGSTVYFHQDGAIDVIGTLNIEGTSSNNVIFRCDRLDSLLNLKYDNIPGKWQGVRLRGGSYNNNIDYLDLHGASYGIVCDSTFDETKNKVKINHTTIHNISGPGLYSVASNVNIENTQISNTLGNCLEIHGGNVNINSSTIAQFYAYTTGRKHALYCDEVYKDKHLPFSMNVKNSIITGYADDEVWYTPYDQESLGDIKFEHCLLRTIEPSEKEKDLFENCIFEDLEDETNGKQNFVLFDTDNFEYDFTPKAESKAVKNADILTSAKDDRNGKMRKENPDIGCYETNEETNDKLSN